MLANPSLNHLPASPEVTYNYLKKTGRIVLTAMEDILGPHGVNAILNLSELPHLVATGQEACVIAINKKPIS